MKRPRDTQRARVYKCGSRGREIGPNPSVADLQAIADRITRSAWWQRYARGRAVTVRPGHGHTRATANADGIVQMPKWSRQTMTLAHELAHVATDSMHGDTVASHGPEFAWAWLQIIRRMDGRTWETMLRAEFKHHGVKVAAWKRENPSGPYALDRATRTLRRIAASEREFLAAM